MTEPAYLAETRDSYDALAVDYADYYRDELAAKPLDRALLGGFAELVQRNGGGPVVDIGCGPGRLTAHLHALGLEVSGIDLSPRMVKQARETYPDLEFHEGSMTSLELDAHSLGGLVTWYSLIHVPDPDLPTAFSEFYRVLAPGGYLQLAFQTGEGLRHWTEAGGHRISLDFHRRQPHRVADMLRHAGVDLTAQTVREPDEEGKYAEDVPQCFLLARKPRWNS